MAAPFPVPGAPRRRVGGAAAAAILTSAMWMARPVGPALAACDQCPTIESVSPGAIAAGDPTVIRIVGNGLAATTMVLLEPGDISVPFTVATTRQLDVRLPRTVASGPHSFIVVTPVASSTADSLFILRVTPLPTTRTDTAASAAPLAPAPTQAAVAVVPGRAGATNSSSSGVVRPSATDRGATATAPASPSSVGERTAMAGMATALVALSGGVALTLWARRRHRRRDDSHDIDVAGVAVSTEVLERLDRYLHD